MSSINECWINIQNGVVQKNSAEFISFRQQHRVQWRKSVLFILPNRCLRYMILISETFSAKQLQRIALNLFNKLHDIRSHKQGWGFAQWTINGFTIFREMGQSVRPNMLFIHLNMLSGGAADRAQALPVLANSYCSGVNGLSIWIL